MMNGPEAEVKPAEPEGKGGRGPGERVSSETVPLGVPEAVEADFV